MTSDEQVDSQQNPTIRLVIIDDHELVRAGIAAKLPEDIAVVGEGADVPGSIAIITQTRPDVVLLDVHLPGGSGGGGGEVAAQVRAALGAENSPKFLALSVSDAPEDVMSVIQSGAGGYVTKSISSAELASSIRTINEGGAVFSPQLAGFVLGLFRGAGAPTNAGSTSGPVAQPDPKIQSLSARETEVLRYIARGYTYREVASKLFISIKTVESHVSSVLRKLQLSSRHELARWAAQQRLI